MISCAHCTAQFEPNQTTQRFCSKKCRNDFYNARQVWADRPDRERKNAKKRAEYQANPEAAARKMREWRASHPKQQKEIERRNRARNGEAIRARHQKWSAENRDYLLGKKREWHEANRDKANGGRRMRGRQTRVNTQWFHILRMAQARAERKGLPFDLTQEWAVERWTGNCELTGLPFKVSTGYGQFFSPSLDRIEPKKGYVIGNCRFILLSLNTFKGTGTDEDMMLVAKSLILQN